MIITDIQGNGIISGDTIVLAVREGDRPTLTMYEILQILPEGEWGEQIVLARVIPSKNKRWSDKRYSNNPSRLHGELFKERALVIKEKYSDEE